MYTNGKADEEKNQIKTYEDVERIEAEVGGVGVESMSCVNMFTLMNHLGESMYNTKMRRMRI